MYKCIWEGGGGEQFNDSRNKEGKGFLKGCIRKGEGIGEIPSLCKKEKFAKGRKLQKGRIASIETKCVKRDRGREGWDEVKYPFNA